MKKLYIIGLVALAAIIIGAVWAEQLTFTTYYPAPYGRYREFSTSGKTTLATDEHGIEDSAFCRVGIGTTNPQGVLHVAGGTATSDDGSDIILQAENGEDTFFGGHGGDIILMPGKGSGEDGVDGNVGIGTTSPSATLDVVGSLEIPNGADPTTDADGEVAWDSDDNAIEVYDGETSRLIPSMQRFSATIYDPDAIQGIEDAIPLLPVETDWAPHGIRLISVGIKTDAASSYSVNFEEWTSPTDGSPSTIERVATGNSTEAKDDGTLTDSDIATGSIVYVDLPDTNVDMLVVWGTYYVKEGD